MSSNPQLISYTNLRRTIGILGLAFPIVLVAGNFAFQEGSPLQSSISAYYHSVMRDVFVGLLCILSVFFYTYKGYDRRDQLVSRAAGLSALGVAFFPTDVREYICADSASSVVGILHLSFAALFFLTLAYMSFFLFTKSGSNASMTLEKMKRNRVYRICGLVMVTCIALLLVYFLVNDKLPCSFRKLSPVFWLETIALWAFGVSWLVKGEMLMSDKSL
jgi:hypothetical protein